MMVNNESGAVMPVDIESAPPGGSPLWPCSTAGAVQGFLKVPFQAKPLERPDFHFLA